MDLVVLNNDETLCIENTSKVVIFFNLTHDIFHLDSDHDHSVLITLIILNGGLTVSVDMMNVDDETFFAVL